MSTIATTNETSNVTSLPSTSKAQTAKEVIAANVKLLIEQVEAGHSGGLTAYLAAMGRFHNYSFGNILEIARQKPEATRVAGMYAWNQLGRKVIKGQKGSFAKNRFNLNNSSPGSYKINSYKWGSCLLSQMAHFVANRCHTPGPSKHPLAAGVIRSTLGYLLTFTSHRHSSGVSCSHRCSRWEKSIRMARSKRTSDSEMLQGTLDMLVLKTLVMGPAHGHTIAHIIEQASEEFLQVEQGSLYPALHRLEDRGWLSSFWGASENNRKAKFYKLTAAGRRQLTQETSRWRQIVRAIGLVIGEDEA